MRAFLATLATSLSLLASVAAAGTLDDVKARGKINCGVNTGLKGFSEKGADGVWVGFDVDYCKALAAAVLGDASKVEYVPLTATDRFDKLKAGAVDVLARNTTWTMERETKMPFRFVGINYHDGQGFMTKSLLGITSVFNLGQASICMINGTTAAANIDDFFKEHDLPYTVQGYENAAAALKEFDAGKCDAISTDQSALYALRLQLAKPDEGMILPEVISKEPLGPSVRVDDSQWFNINRWVLFALINAEELEIRQPIVDDLIANSKKPAVKRLLGVEGTLGADLGLDKDWAARAIKAVGNYGESFDRHLGEASALKIQRGLNATWDKGGVLYAPPVR